MSEKDILYRIIACKKAERDNILVRLDFLVLEINALTTAYNKLTRRKRWMKK